MTNDQADDFEVRGFNGFATDTNPLPGIRWVDDPPRAETPEQAITVTAIFACVRFLAETLASMPTHLYQRTPGGRRLLTDHPLHRVLCVRPNHWQSCYEYTEQQIYHTALYGNAYSLIVPTDGNWCGELRPLHPSRMRPERVEDGSIRYRYWHPAGEERIYTADQIFHLRGLSDDGLMGVMPAELCRASIDLARKLDLAALSYWENNARPTVLLEVAQQVPETAMEKLRNSWRRMFGGVRNQGQTAVLPPGVTARVIEGASREGSEYMALRNAIVTEVARAFRVGPTLIGCLDHGTYSNVEMEQLGAQVFTLTPWQRRREQAIGRSLLSTYGDDLYVQMDSRGLMRGDSAARANYFTTLFQLGALSPNDIRRLEDFEPIEDAAADDYFVQLNMAPLSKAAPPDAPAGDTPDAPAIDQAAPVAEQALNGAQITSLLEVLNNLAAGLLTPTGAKAIIAASFPTLADSQIEAMVAGVVPGAAAQAAAPPTPPAAPKTETKKRGR